MHIYTPNVVVLFTSQNLHYTKLFSKAGVLKFPSDTLRGLHCAPLDIGNCALEMIIIEARICT